MDEFRNTKRVVHVGGQGVAQTYQMLVGDTSVVGRTFAANVNIVLPPVAECAGRIYYIQHEKGAAASVNVAENAADGNTIYVSSSRAATNFNLANTALIVMYSDGTRWFALL